MQGELNYLKAAALLKAGEAELASIAHPDKYKRKSPLFTAVVS